ncbi:hypothetical protein SNE40_022080 [Patella caerulea]|uniref:Uncharacterized protein n=1 Tax=Patella caerulea TaxID=87958 RepID=A0AAN8GD64_PATCE
MSRTSSTYGKQGLLRPSYNNFGDLKVTPSKRFPSSSSIRKSTSSWASGVNSGVSFARRSSKSICNNNNDLANIEASYIKNLQQQIYFLELESNYLYPLFIQDFIYILYFLK